jgi:hypothetical protein
MSPEEKGAAMSKKNWSNILSGLARAALAFVFVFGQTAWAMQGQNVSDKPTPNAVAKPPQTPRNPSAASSKAQPQASGEQAGTAQNPSAEGRSERGGQHEGITVHGHWSIEVHDPKGAIVRHVEFENSLDPGFTDTHQTPPLIAPGGGSYLSALLSGQWTAPVAPTSWAILFVGPSGLTNLVNPASPNAPCLTGPPLNAAACIIEPVAGPDCASQAGPGYSCNLSVTAVGTFPFFTGIQLSGSVAATQNGQISTVASVIDTIGCPSSVSNCQISHAVASFTSSTNFPGAPISVSAGQTIAVTVTISFS